MRSEESSGKSQKDSEKLLEVQPKMNLCQMMMKLPLDSKIPAPHLLNPKSRRRRCLRQNHLANHGVQGGIKAYAEATEGEKGTCIIVAQKEARSRV